jgi:hypothetical protein
MRRLPLVDQYSAMELYRGTMLRHNVILHCNDDPGAQEGISFEGESWLHQIPIRIPETISVQERLPRGASAVLINQAHSYSDLYMPIDAAEKHWFEGIDGSTGIAKIIESAKTSPQKTTRLDKARAFFERLWWYDQVVFDASPNYAIEKGKSE